MHGMRQCINRTCVPDRTKPKPRAVTKAACTRAQLWFDHVRVPRDALLDAFASVGPDGAYSSAIPSVSQRFGTMVGGLTTGASAPTPTMPWLIMLSPCFIARSKSCCEWSISRQPG